MAAVDEVPCLRRVRLDAATADELPDRPRAGRAVAHALTVRAFTYARYSTDRQTEASIADQQRRCHEYAAARGWSIAADFVDEGISGGALGNRPGVQAVLAELASGDVLLLADLSRLSRSQELAPILERLRFRGVRVLGVLDGYDSGGELADMQAGLSGLMSAEFRKSIRLRTHSALQMRAKTGRPTGGKVYGFTKGGELLEAEAVIVREIFQRTAAGESTRSIADDLNTRRVPSAGAEWKRTERRRDGLWLMSALHEMLGNERYIGRLVWNRSEWVKDPDSGKRTRRLRPESEWVVTGCPAIVDATTWEHVAARMRERSHRRGGHGARRRRYLLSGLLVCEYCGAPLTVVGVGAPRYQCSSRAGGGASACRLRATISRRVAEHIVLEPIYRDLLSPEAVERSCRELREAFAAELAAPAVDADPELAAIDAQVAELEALVAERPAIGVALQGSIAQLRERRVAVLRASRRRTVVAQTAVIPAEAAYRAAVAELDATLSGGNVDAARAALRSLVGTIGVLEHDGKPYGRIGYDWSALFGKPADVRFCGSGGRI